MINEHCGACKSLNYCNNLHDHPPVSLYIEGRFGIFASKKKLFDIPMRPCDPPVVIR